VTGDDFQPSERLILEATSRRESVLHVWDATETASSPAFTVSQGVDWAYCTPVGGKACQGWGIYVAGRFAGGAAPAAEASDPTDLRDDLKFTELAAATLSALRDVRMLERQRAGLSQFFSPVVLEALAAEDPEIVLTPREAEVAVLFCDLRGFSRQSEKSADDLHGLLNRVSRALGVTTHQIREQGGVLGDFHGDAAMGFWGWPLAQPDAAARACLAALAIRAEFAAAAGRAGDPLADFRMGIGIATGRAVAGKIGTVDQVKVTVFGPVVNLAARLEGMTKTLQAPILLDDQTAAAVRSQLTGDVARLRRVAVVKPYGLQQPLEVSELLPPVRDYPQLTDQNVADYERALDDLLAGRWPQAFERLHRVPADDRVKDFLTVFIAQHNRTPPENWNGVIPLTSK
jgi:adenylate cyclase